MGPLAIGLAIGFFVGAATKAWNPVLVVFALTVFVVISAPLYLLHNYAKIEIIPQRLEELRLADVRALRLYDLYRYMIELQKKLLEQSRMDAAYRICEKELPLREHLDRFAAQMETLESSFRDHGDLGTLLEVEEIQNIGSKEIVKVQLEERDSEDRRRAMLEVENSIGLKR